MSKPTSAGVKGNVSAKGRVMEHNETHGKWASLVRLRRLYEENRDRFFELATAEGSSREALSTDARHIRAFVREGFDVSPNGNTVKIIGRRSTYSVPKEEADNIVAFLHELNGTSVGKNPARDYKGKKISKAELAFKLGNGPEREAARAGVAAHMNAAREVLKLDEQDRRAVTGGMPGYVVFNLLHCVPKVLQSPAVVFRGLRLQGGLREGRAYCGKPRWAFDNSGHRVAPPSNMCFVVYVDGDGFVFDWDWVKENEKHGYPENWRQRFIEELSSVPEPTLIGLDGIQPAEFTPSKAWFSRRGDCLFWYKSDAVAYAIRVNDELTAFKSLDGKEVVGCKLKNVAIIAETFRHQLATILQQLLTGRMTDLRVILASSLVRQASLEPRTREDAKEYATYKALLGDLLKGQPIVTTPSVFLHEMTSDESLPF
jgi:hypothetical protein